MRKIKNVVINLVILLIILCLFFGIGEIIVRLSGNCEISPLKSGNLFTFFEKVDNPKLQYELKPNREGYLFGKWVKINSLGLRDHEYLPKKPEGIHRIGVLGDSITFGTGVELNYSYPKLLEKKLKNNIQVINFGVPGYTGSQEYVVLKEKVINYEPDLIIIGHFLNDGDAIWNPYRTTIPIPPSIKIFFNEHFCFYNWAKYRWSKLLNRAGLGKEAPYKELFIEDSEIWKNHKILIEQFANISKEENIPILFIILPVWEDLNENYKFKKEHYLLNKTIIEAGLYSLDLFPVVEYLDAEGYKVVKKDNTHPNAEGHKLIADAIYEYLINNRLINF